MSEFRMFQGTLCGRHGGSYWFLRERLKFLKGIPGGPSPKAQALSFEPSTLESKSSTRPPHVGVSEIWAHLLARIAEKTPMSTEASNALRHLL